MGKGDKHSFTSLLMLLLHYLRVYFTTYTFTSLLTRLLHYLCFYFTTYAFTSLLMLLFHFLCFYLFPNRLKLGGYSIYHKVEHPTVCPKNVCIPATK